MAIHQGSVAEEVERLSDDQILDMATSVLSKTYPDVPKDLTQPLAHLVCRWADDPRFLGAYSMLNVGALSTFEEE